MGKEFTPHVVNGANITGGEGGSIFVGVKKNEKYCRILDLASTGAVKLIDDRYVRTAIKDLGPGGFEIGVRSIRPGNSIETSLNGTQLTITATAKKGVTFNGKKAEVITAERDSQLYPVRR